MQALYQLIFAQSVTEQVFQVIMPKQLRSTRTSRGRRQATSAATSKRPYTRRSQPNAPAAADQNPLERRHAH